MIIYDIMYSIPARIIHTLPLQTLRLVGRVVKRVWSMVVQRNCPVSLLTWRDQCKLLLQPSLEGWGHALSLSMDMPEKLLPSLVRVYVYRYIHIHLTTHTTHTTADPLEESSVWQEEDMDLLVSYSTKLPSPAYTRRKRDPMGPPSSTSAGGKKKLSHENLGAMFPHGETEAEHTLLPSFALQVVVICWLRTSTQPGFFWRDTASVVLRHVKYKSTCTVYLICLWLHKGTSSQMYYSYMICTSWLSVCVCVCVCV